MGPLEGIKVIEMGGLAPSPYCGMLLSDFGAEVVVMDRLLKHEPEIPGQMKRNPFDRGKRSIRVNIKSAKGIDYQIKKMAWYEDQDHKDYANNRNTCYHPRNLIYRYGDDPGYHSQRH